MTQSTADFLKSQLAAESASLPEPETPAQETEPVAAPKPKSRKKKRRYDEMARVEGRLTEQQLRRLDQLRVDLMKRRTRTGDRITNNTLLRIAVEGLLSARRELVGSDEEELMTSYLDWLERAKAKNN